MHFRSRFRNNNKNNNENKNKNNNENNNKNKFSRLFVVLAFIGSVLMIATKGGATTQLQSQACRVVFAPPSTGATSAHSASIQEILAELETLRASALEREKSRQSEGAIKASQELIGLGLADDLLLERAVVDKDLQVVLESNALDRAIAWALMGEGNKTRRDVDTAIDNFDLYTLEGTWTLLKRVVENLVYAIEIVDLKVMNVPEQRAQAERLGVSIREYLRFIPVWEQQSKRSFNEVMIAVLNILHHPSNDQKMRILGQVDQLNKFTLWYSKKGARPELVVDSDHGGITTASLKTFFEGASSPARVAMLTEQFSKLTEGQIVAMQTWKGWDALPEAIKSKLTHKFGRLSQMEMAPSPESVVENSEPNRKSDSRMVLTKSSEEVQSLMRNIDSIHGQEAFLRALTEFFPKNLQRQIESMGRLLTPDEALFISHRLYIKSRESGFHFQDDGIRVHKEYPFQNSTFEMFKSFKGHVKVASLCGVGFCLMGQIIGAQTEFSLVTGVAMGSFVTAVGSVFTLIGYKMENKKTVKVSPTVGAVLTQVLSRTDLSSISDSKLKGFLTTLFSSEEELVVIGEYLRPNSNGGFSKHKSFFSIRDSVEKFIRAQRDAQKLNELEQNKHTTSQK